jgi:transposase-like protein
MATSASKLRVPRRHLPLAEKRRIVELTLRAGASVDAIAREHGVRANSLHRWRRCLAEIPTFRTQRGPFIVKS